MAEFAVSLSVSVFVPISVAFAFAVPVAVSVSIPVSISVPVFVPVARRTLSPAALPLRQRGCSIFVVDVDMNHIIPVVLFGRHGGPCQHPLKGACLRRDGEEEGC